MGRPSLYIKSVQVPEPSKTTLLMIAGERHFIYALLNKPEKELVEFGYYTSENKLDFDWPDFFEQNELFRKKYLQSAIAYDVKESVLVPVSYYKEEDALLQLTAVYGNYGEVPLLTEYLPEWNMYDVYSVPAALHSTLSKNKFSDQSRNIKSVLLKNFSGDKAGAMLLDFSTNEFTVIVFKNNLLQLAHSFAYSSPEDALYYLLKICRQSDLSQQDVQIRLTGFIEKDSAIYREIYKYFIHLEFEEPVATIKIADALKEYPLHFYSTICKLAACV